MDTGFFAYLQQLELMAFFSGYPLLYGVVNVIAGNDRTKTTFKSRIFYLLPIGYALAGSLYVGLQLRTLYPDYSLAHINELIQQPYWMGWGVLSIFFWLPVLHRKPVFSLLHSIVFFFLLARDILLQTMHPRTDNSVVRNDMKIYTDSLLLHLGTLTLVTLLFFLIKRLKSKRGHVSSGK